MFIQLLKSDPRQYVAVVLVVIISICLHELAHGIVAVRRGDRTPIDQGRLTLNPLVQMGPVSLVVLLISGIAWGAMPIDRTRLRGRYAEALVAVAGPLTNVILAVVALTALGLWQRSDPRVAFGEIGDFADNGRLLLRAFGVMNVALALFNMLPLPPLDGSHVLANFSRSYGRLADAIVMNGASIILFILVFSTAGRFIFPAARNAADWYLRHVRGW
jgi:Zn-dependent protease